MQLASDGFAFFNPVTLRLAKKFGGTHEGHQNSQIIQTQMYEEGY